MSKRDGGGGALRDRTAVVTGASSSIGAAITVSLCQASARVVAVGRSASRLPRLGPRSPSSFGSLVPLVADLREPDWLTKLDRVAPDVDVLVHGAMAERGFAAVEDADPDQLDALVQVGLTAAVRAAAQVLPGMKRRGFGRIVLLGSLVGRSGGYGQAAYAATKAGLVGLARSLALEAGPHGVTVNVLELGLIETERTRSELDDRTRQGLVAGTPLRRGGLPSDVAHAVRFLCGPEGAFITGAVIPVSGGLGLGLPRGDGGSR